MIFLEQSLKFEMYECWISATLDLPHRPGEKDSTFVLVIKTKGEKESRGKGKEK